MEAFLTSIEAELGKIKKWILPGEGRSKTLAVIGGKADRDVKVIYKKYGVETSQHITLKITKAGLVDIHLTEEREPKKYTSLFKGHVDLPTLKEQAEALYKKSLEPVDINDPTFADYYLSVPKSREAYVEFYLKSYIQDSKIVLPASRKEERQIARYVKEYFEIFPFNEAANKQIPFAICTNEEGEMGILMSEKKNYYFFSITEAMNIFFNSIKPNL